MTPVPVAAAAAHSGASAVAENKSREEDGDELVPVSVYERSESSTTTEKSGGGFSLSGGSGNEQQILLLLVLAGVIIFIQHDASGKAQQGTQFAALGVVGFILLVIAQFSPEIAMAFTVLFVVAVVLNSPNGVPLVSKATSYAAGSGNVDPNAVAPLSPAQVSVNTQPIIVPGSQTGLKAN
jgi:hypothetical protein